VRKGDNAARASPQSLHSRVRSCCAATTKAQLLQSRMNTLPVGQGGKGGRGGGRRWVKVGVFHDRLRLRLSLRLGLSMCARAGVQ
jgi:hypothetical protein